MIDNTTKWFTSWFDSPYYHTLYKDRDAAEAQFFMDTITHYLNIPAGGRILDLGCGKGRHARYLNKIGYDVTGVDLSENSIAFAKQFENHRLRFTVHDMSTYIGKQYDAVFNVFTSFGYFEKYEDNLNTIKAIKTSLNETGFGVIDFMNANFVAANLVTQEVKEVDGIKFFLKRYKHNGYIVKDITFTDNDVDYSFHERVRAFSLADFEALFEQANIDLLDVFGDYKLNKYNVNSSERLVMIFK